jgi:hypothetical protein
MIITGIETGGLTTRIGGMILTVIIVTATMAMQGMITRITGAEAMTLDVKVMEMMNAEDIMAIITTEIATWKITTGDITGVGMEILPA